MKGTAIGVAAALAACFLASGAAAVRFAPGGVRIEPPAVYLTRTLTVRVAVEDTSGYGADTMEVTCQPVPDGYLRPVAAVQPPIFTCTSGGRSQGWFGWEAIKPGDVRFRLTVSLVSCVTGNGENAEILTEPVKLMPVPMDSELKATPERAGPGETIEIELNLRNHAPEFAIFGRPPADVEMVGRTSLPAVPIDGPIVEPAGVLDRAHMILPAGSGVRIRWHYRALGPGDAVFRVSAAGLIMMTRPVVIRNPAVLSVGVEAPRVPSAVGETYAIRADVGVTGETGARGVFASVDWSPAAAARLVSATISSGSLDPAEPPARASFVLELLKPGPLMFTVSAAGVEADSGRRLGAAPVTRLLAVQSPPELSCRVRMTSTPVLVGTEVPLRIAITNKSPHATLGLTPLLEVAEGDVTVQAFSPLYQAVPAASTVYFSGAVVPEAPGRVDVVAKATGRGERGGERVTIVSNHAGFHAVARPSLLVFSLSGELWEGVTSTIRFLLANPGPDELRISSMGITLSAPAGTVVPPVKPRPATLALAAGASATLSFPLCPPVTRAAYDVTGLLAVTGKVAAYGIPFTERLPARQLASVRPRATRIQDVQPDDVFRPVDDPLLYVEWTSTMTGELGLAVIAPDGRVVGVIRPLGPVKPGRYVDLWRGQDAGGEWVKPGQYTLRLAGPSPAAPWPQGSAWRQDRPFQVGAP